MRKIAIGLVLTVWLACLGGASFAADTITKANAPLNEWIDNSSGNTANQLLCSTIGDPGGTGLFGCKGKEVALHKILKVFNLAVFSIGALFVAWVLISAIMSSAAEGEFLGKRNHSQWGPLRMTMGGAALVPAFGGFNLAQLVMVWATAVGVGIAGAGVSAASSSMETLTNTYSAPVGMLSGRDIALQLEDKTACVAKWEKQVNRWNSDGVEDSDATGLRWGYTVRDVSTREGIGVQLFYGALGATGGYLEDDCGTVTIRVPDASKATDSGVKSIFSAIANAIRQSLPTLAGVMLTEYRNIALAAGPISAAERVASSERIKAAADAYDAAVSSVGAAAAASANSSSTKYSIAKGDWIAAGFVSVKGSIKSFEVGKGVNGQPESTEVKRQAPIKDDIPDLTYLDGVPSASPKDSSSFSATNIVSVINTELKSQVDRLGKATGSHLTNIAKMEGNPLVALSSFGVEISLWMAGVLVGSIVIFVGISLASVLTPAIGGVITFVGFILSALAIPLFFFGVKLAAYLPFLPAVIWTGAVLNWLVIVVEALFGAPLWAMVRLDMEGDGLNMQRTGHGYIFLLNLFFRPIMMVGALVFAYSAMSAMFGLFVGAVSGMLNGLSSNTSSWWAGLLMIVGAVWIVVVFAEQIITQCLGLVFLIPDKVFAWIGGHFGSSVGNDLDRSVTGNAERGFGAASNVGREGALMGSRGAATIAERRSPAARQASAEAQEKASFDAESRRRTRARWAADDAGSGSNQVGPSGGSGSTQAPSGFGE